MFSPITMTIFGFVFFIVMGVVFATGKGLNLISGYKNAPQSEKDRYDEKKLSQGFSLTMFVFAGCMLLAIAGELIQMKLLSYIGYAALIILSFVMVIAVAKNAEKK